MTPEQDCKSEENLNLKLRQGAQATSNIYLLSPSGTVFHRVQTRLARVRRKWLPSSVGRMKKSP